MKYLSTSQIQRTEYLAETKQSLALQAKCICSVQVIRLEQIASILMS